MKSLMNFLRDERGAISVEYVMVTGGSGIGVYAAVKTLGDATNSKFDGVTDTIIEIDTSNGGGTDG